MIVNADPEREVNWFLKRTLPFSATSQVMLLSFEKVNVSNKSKSSMNLGDKKLNRKINNLQKLMGIIVEFPFLRPFTKFLISLPLSFLYTWIYFAFYGFKYLQHSSFKGILLTFVHYIKFYFKYVSMLEKKIKEATS